jgi:hypothetical protein
MQSISESQSHSSAVSLALSSVDLSSSSGVAPAAAAAGGTNLAASRLFFNPAFSVDGKSGVDVNASIAPGYAKSLPGSARGPAGAAPTSARPFSARLNEESVQDRRAKLDALRAAVKALEQQQASKGGLPMPPANTTADIPSAAAADKQQEKKFLPGRPTVPRLSLSTLNAPPQRQRRPGRPVARQDSVPESDLIKSHPGPLPTMVVAPVAVPDVAPQVAPPKRASPGAALARGAKSIFKDIKTTLKTGSPKPKAAVVVPPKPSSGPVYSSGGYNDVMKKVEGALERSSAGNSPVKQGTSARGAGPSRIPAPPPAAWR